MTITNRVQGAFFTNVSESEDVRVIRLAPNAPPSKGPTRRQGRPWTHEEHDRFLHAMEMYPSGPWKDIAAHVGTRTTRQTMTHAQKYRQKIERWKRGASITPASTVSNTEILMPSPPLTPEQQDVMALAESSEEAMFWHMLEDILEVEDDGQFEQSLSSLMAECQPMEFTTMLAPHEASFTYARQGMSYKVDDF